MPVWLVGGGAVGAVALILWLALHNSGGQAATMPAPGGAPSGVGGDGTTSGGSSGGDQPGPSAMPLLSLSGTGLDGYTGTTGSPADTSGGVAATSPSPYSGSGPYVNSLQPGTIYSTPGSPTGFSAVQPSGAFQPAYIGPSGAFVSPGTYIGYGATPQAITPGMVAPPVFNPGPSLSPPSSPPLSGAQAIPRGGQAVAV